MSDSTTSPDEVWPRQAIFDAFDRTPPMPHIRPGRIDDSETAGIIAELGQLLAVGHGGPRERALNLAIMRVAQWPVLVATVDRLEPSTGVARNIDGSPFV